PQGPQGTQGPTGPQGPCCPVTGTYAVVYSLTDQTVMPGGSPLLELLGPVTASFNVSMAPITGEVTVLKSGVYQILWSVDGIVTPPIPSPVPSMSLGIYVNNVLAPSTTGANFAISPDNDCTHTTVSSLVVLNAGDVVKLVNTSTNAINFVST